MTLPIYIIDGEIHREPANMVVVRIAGELDLFTCPDCGELLLVCECEETE